MSGQPSYVELGVPDPERAIAFYGALLGWEAESMPGGGQVSEINESPGFGRWVECRDDQGAVRPARDELIRPQADALEMRRTGTRAHTHLPRGVGSTPHSAAIASTMASPRPSG